MNKTELIEHVAAKVGLAKIIAAEAVEAMTTAITANLEDGNDVHLHGLGTFAVAERAARTGRNPATGDSIDIPAKRAVKFKPAKALRDALNG